MIQDLIKFKLALDARQKRAVAIGALALAVVLFGDVIYQTVMHVRWRNWVNRYAVAAQPAATQPAGTQPSTQPGSAGPGRPEGPPRPIQVSAAIRKRNLFAPPVVKAHKLILTGVLGNLAFFRHQDNPSQTITIAEGASDKGVTVQSINGYEVTILYDGKPQVLKLFDGPGGQPPPVAGPMAGPAGGPVEMRSGKGPPPMPSPGDAVPMPAGRSPRAVKGAELPPGVVIEGNITPEMMQHMEFKIENR